MSEKAVLKPHEVWYCYCSQRGGEFCISVELKCPFCGKTEPIDRQLPLPNNVIVGPWKREN